MTVSQFEAESLSNGNNEQGVLMEDAIKISSASTQSRRNPPARNTSRFWFERFLAVIQRQNPSVIDASFISQIAPSNEGKLLAQLKFLHVVDDQGKPTQLLSMLNMVGDEQKRAFQEIAQESYRELFGEVKIERAVPDDLVNFFIRKYSFTRDKAVNAAKFFLYLAEKGTIPVSNELSTFLTEKSGTSQISGSPLSSSRSFEAPKIRLNQKEPKGFPIPTQGRQLIQQRKRATEMQFAEGQTQIQTIINIRLDKDTPREYWDRVLSLVGERKATSEVQVENAISGDEAGQISETIDQELTADSNFS